jgi:hypothetical protein
MDTVDFAQTYSELSFERHSQINRRTELETELVEVRNRIAHLDEVLAHLAPLADISVDPNSIAGLGLTDAIRKILVTADDKMTAQDIRKRLVELDYDLSGLTAQMASIYKILSRLVEDSKEVDREKEDGRVYYKWKHPPITDEDIPF